MRFTPTEKITAVIERYQKKKDWQPSDLEIMLSMARYLATEIFYLAVDLGESHKDWNGAEYRRKSTFAKVCKKIADDAFIAGEKLSGSEIERRASLEIDEHLKEEKMAESTYRAYYFLYESSKGVHDQLRQHISSFKHEKRLEDIGAGSQM